jgi:prolyl oligopeptidase PreP (S9A serine peptidase family)
MTQRPELFRAAVAEVPQVDVLRYDRGRHRPQFGSAADPAQFPFLHAYAPLQRVRARTCYPATLVTTALNDERAPAWHAFKLVAALQAAQGCARPVLLRADTAGGHGALAAPGRVAAGPGGRRGLPGTRARTGALTRRPTRAVPAGSRARARRAGIG